MINTFVTARGKQSQKSQTRINVQHAAKQVKEQQQEEQQNKQQHAIFAYSFGRQAIRDASLGYALVGSWRFCLNFQDIRSK